MLGQYEPKTMPQPVALDADVSEAQQHFAGLSNLLSALRQRRDVLTKQVADLESQIDALASTAHEPQACAPSRY